MQSNVSERRCVVMVLGMARSGTSAITRGLKAIGVNLGSKLLRADNRNPTGFFEDTDITFKINRGILRELDAPWMLPDLAETMRRGDHVLLDKYRQYAVRLLRERLDGCACWGFKDTNTATLLPFWQHVLHEADAEDRYVFALRNPLGCAYSNIKHSNLDLEAGLLGWLKNMMLAVAGTHGKKRVVVSYDLLLQNPVHELERMRRHLDIHTTNEAEMDAYVRKFVDQSLHHHAYSDDDLASHAAISAVPLCGRVYPLLMRVAADALAFDDAEFISAWHDIQRDYDALYPLYEYANDLLKQSHQLQREIRVIKKSVPWKLFYPLRLLFNGRTAYAAG
jgi:hypothetical protein